MPEQDGPSAVLACNDQGVNWRELRNELARLRVASGHTSVPAFADALGVQKTTIYRIEKHQTEPDITTIEAWLRETTRESIGLFLTRFDDSAQKDIAQPQVVTSAVTPSMDTTDSADSPSRSESHGFSGSEVQRSLTPEQLAQVFEHLGFALLRAGEGFRVDQTVSAPPDEAAGSGQSRAVSGRKASADVRRLTRRK
jgi:DNA-binding XRE family transcriptional regulator